MTPLWQGLASAPRHRSLPFELQGMSCSLQKVRYALVFSQESSPLFSISQLHCWENSSQCQPREGEEGERGCPGRRLGQPVLPTLLQLLWQVQGCLGRYALQERRWFGTSWAQLLVTPLFGWCCDTGTRFLDNDNESEMVIFIDLHRHQVWTEPHSITKFHFWNLEFFSLINFKECWRQSKH